MVITVVCRADYFPPSLQNYNVVDSYPPHSIRSLRFEVNILDLTDLKAILVDPNVLSIDIVKPEVCKIFFASEAGRYASEAAKLRGN